MVVSGPDFGKTLALGEGTFRIGKQPDSHLVLTDPAVSREHLELRVERTGIRLCDRGSRNGSFYRGMRFETLEVTPGAVIRIGQSDLQVLLGDEAPPMRPSEARAFGDLVAESLSMRRAFAVLERAAAGGADVLLQGETGTGKDLAAEALHARGCPPGSPFVVCDLAAVSPSLIESELFGHVRGAFTGALGDRAGAFERAHGGTIFLDEVGDLPLELQPRLLRALERRQVKRVGGDRYQTLDFRVVAATHKNLEEETAAGCFREDLYHRLAMVTVVLPPLHERLEDLDILVGTLLDRLGVAARRGDFLSPSTKALLCVYDWPGNVRELRNVVERAVKLDAAPYIPRLKSRKKGGGAQEVSADRPFKEAKERIVAAFERDYLADLMNRCDHNVSQAARAAGIARVYVHRLLQKHGLTKT